MFINWEVSFSREWRCTIVKIICNITFLLSLLWSVSFSDKCRFKLLAQWKTFCCCYYYCYFMLENQRTERSRDRSINTARAHNVISTASSLCHISQRKHLCGSIWNVKYVTLEQLSSLVSFHPPNKCNDGVQHVSDQQESIWLGVYGLFHTLYFSITVVVVQILKWI